MDYLELSKNELTTIQGGSELSEAIYRLAGYLYEAHLATMKKLKELRETSDPDYHSFL